MTRLYSTARAERPRGAGLGNEVLAWAKSFLHAEALGAKLLPPQWAFNRYRLAGEFGWSASRLFVSQAFVAAAPSFRVGEALYRSAAADDYGHAMLELHDAGKLPRSGTVIHEGMWGGYHAIERAKPFLRQQIEAAPGVIRHLTKHCGRRHLEVAVHVRLGDFSEAAPASGSFNSVLPLEWYESVIDRVRCGLPNEAVRFSLFTNGTETELRRLLRHDDTQLASGKLLLDLASMYSADLLICSVSSLSMLGAFLSGRPYIWYRPQLVQSAPGRLTIWGLEEEQRRPQSPTSRALEHYEPDGRGFHMDVGDELPARLQDWLRRALVHHDWRTDLLLYGNVAMGANRCHA